MTHYPIPNRVRTPKPMKGKTRGARRKGIVVRTVHMPAMTRARISFSLSTGRPAYEMPANYAWSFVGGIG